MCMWAGGGCVREWLHAISDQVWHVRMNISVSNAISSAIQLWPNNVKVIKHWEALCDSKRPKSKSYKRLAEHHLDKPILVIMQFAQDVASQLKVFFAVVSNQQSYGILSWICSRRCSPHFSENGSRSWRFRSGEFQFETIQVLDLSNSGNPLPCELIKLPTATKSSIRSADLSNEKKGSFVKNAKQMIVVLIQIRFRNVAHLNIKLHVAHPHSPVLTWYLISRNMSTILPG